MSTVSCAAMCRTPPSVDKPKTPPPLTEDEIDAHVDTLTLEWAHLLRLDWANCKSVAVKLREKSKVMLDEINTTDKEITYGANVFVRASHWWCNAVKCKRECKQSAVSSICRHRAHSAQCRRARRRFSVRICHSRPHCRRYTIHARGRSRQASTRRCSVSVR